MYRFDHSVTKCLLAPENEGCILKMMLLYHNELIECDVIMNLYSIKIIQF